MSDLSTLQSQQGTEAGFSPGLERRPCTMLLLRLRDHADIRLQGCQCPWDDLPQEALLPCVPQHCLSSPHTPGLACSFLPPHLCSDSPLGPGCYNTLPNPYPLNLLSQSPVAELHSDISSSRKTSLPIPFSVRLGPSSLCSLHTCPVL